MYTVHAYYLAVVCQALSVVLIYPCCVTLFSFYFFDLEYHSAADLFTYMASLLCIALTGSFTGLAIGTLTDQETVGILIGNLVVMLFNFGAGCFANTGDGANPVIKFLSWVSPIHYGVEILFRQVTKGRVGQEKIL